MEDNFILDRVAGAAEIRVYCYHGKKSVEECGVCYCKSEEIVLGVHCDGILSEVVVV